MINSSPPFVRKQVFNDRQRLGSKSEFNRNNNGFGTAKIGWGRQYKEKAMDNDENEFPIE